MKKRSEEVIATDSDEDSDWVFIEDLNPTGLDCPICFDNVPLPKGKFLNCEHFFCTSCLNSYINAEIDSLAVSGKHTVVCPISKCMHAITEREIAQVVGQRKLNRLQRLSLEQVASRESSLGFCPFPDCGNIFSVSEEDRHAAAEEFAQAKAKGLDSPLATRNILQPSHFSTARETSSGVEHARARARMACPKCDHVFCIICHHDWGSCRCARQQQKENHMKDQQQEEGRSLMPWLPISGQQLRLVSKNWDSNLQFHDCKRCGIKIEKVDGCDKMKCRCGYRFCFHCGAENAQCNCTPANHGFWDNESNTGDFSNLNKKKSPHQK